MRIIDAEALVKDFSVRAVSARNWKERAIMEKNEEAIIRADATLAFLSEVKLTIDNAKTVEVPEEVNCVLTMFGKCSYNETGCSDCEIKDKIRKALNDRPAGEWIIDGHHYKCSRCGKTLAIMFSETDDDDLIGCPFCLADMRVKRRER